MTCDVCPNLRVSEEEDSVELEKEKVAAKVASNQSRLNDLILPAGGCFEIGSSRFRCRNPRSANLMKKVARSG